MKFGKTFERSQVAEWAESYLDYKEGKKLLKSLCDELEAAKGVEFEARFRSETAGGASLVPHRDVTHGAPLDASAVDASAVGRDAAAQQVGQAAQQGATSSSGTPEARGRPLEGRRLSRAESLPRAEPLPSSGSLSTEAMQELRAEARRVLERFLVAELRRVDAKYVAASTSTLQKLRNIERYCGGEELGVGLGGEVSAAGRVGGSPGCASEGTPAGNDGRHVVDVVAPRSARSAETPASAGSPAASTQSTSGGPSNGSGGESRQSDGSGPAEMLSDETSYDDSWVERCLSGDTSSARTQTLVQHRGLANRIAQQQPAPVSFDSPSEDFHAASWQKSPLAESLLGCGPNHDGAAPAGGANLAQSMLSSTGGYSGSNASAVSMNRNCESCGAGPKSAACSSASSKLFCEHGGADAPKEVPRESPVPEATSDKPDAKVVDKQLVTVWFEVEKLEQFCLLNLTALRKFLKKVAKNLGPDFVSPEHALVLERSPGGPGCENRDNRSSVVNRSTDCSSSTGVLAGISVAEGQERFLRHDAMRDARDVPLASMMETGAVRSPEALDDSGRAKEPDKNCKDDSIFLSAESGRLRPSHESGSWTEKQSSFAGGSEGQPTSNLSVLQKTKNGYAFTGFTHFCAHVRRRIRRDSERFGSMPPQEYWTLRPSGATQDAAAVVVAYFLGTRVS